MTDNISRKAAIEAAPCTAVDPNVTDYDRGYFDATITYQKALTALPAVDGWLDLLTFMAVVSAAGGKITTLPEDAVKARQMRLERFEDPKSGGFVFRLTPLPAPPEGIDQ